MQCVETNPGPSKGRGARTSLAGTSSVTDSLPLIQPLPDTRSNRRTEHPASQSSLMSWMHSQHDINDEVTAGMDYDYNSETGSEPGVNNPAFILLEIRKDVKSLNSKFDSLSKSVNQ